MLDTLLKSLCPFSLCGVVRHSILEIINSIKILCKRHRAHIYTHARANKCLQFEHIIAEHTIINQYIFCIFLSAAAVVWSEKWNGCSVNVGHSTKTRPHNWTATSARQKKKTGGTKRKRNFFASIIFYMLQSQCWLGSKTWNRTAVIRCCSASERQQPNATEEIQHVVQKSKMRKIAGIKAQSHNRQRKSHTHTYI